MSTPSEPGSLIGAAVAASLTIPAGTVQSVTFSVAWACLEINFQAGRTYHRHANKCSFDLIYTPIYICCFSTLTECINFAIRRYTEFYGTHGNMASSIAHDAIVGKLSTTSFIILHSKKFFEGKNVKRIRLMCLYFLTFSHLLLYQQTIERFRWESEIEAWQRPILEDKRLPEW